MQNDKKVNIDIEQLDTITCDECGGDLWDEKAMFKKVPAIVSPNGKEGMLPIPIQVCVNCGMRMHEMMERQKDNAVV